MRRRRARAAFQAPSLVPLADMLSNTVGVMVFVLIFAVLTAGGVLVPIRLPVERQTDAKMLAFVCVEDRVLPLHDMDALLRSFVKPLGTPAFRTVDTWVKRFNSRRIDGEYFLMTGEGEAQRYETFFSTQVSLDLTVAFAPRGGRGESSRELERPQSTFREIMRKYKPADRFIYFIVHPDGMRVFKAARMTAAEAGFSTGWGPWEAGKPVKVSLTGNGRTPAVQ